MTAQETVEYGHAKLKFRTEPPYRMMDVVSILVRDRSPIADIAVKTGWSEEALEIVVKLIEVAYGRE
jgi:hypothetical protein